MKHGISILTALISTASLHAAEFRHIGDFAIRSRIKIVEDQAFPTTIKPLRLSAYTDGITVRISTTGDPENASEYTIYRSDGIGRQQSQNGALEVIPGVQASSDKGGVLRQLRLTERTLTLTSFPGVSNQVVVTHAVAIAPPKAVPADPQTADR